MTLTAAPPDAPPGLDEALRDPGFYGTSSPVEVRETHASVVFLVGSDAYKLKKPVDFGFLDYSTLARRKLMCRREVELNRRLAPGVYLGVVPVMKGPAGFALGGRGQTVDYLVHMRRLDDQESLSALVRSGRATEMDALRVARRIAAFHAKAASGPTIGRFGRPAAIALNHEENFDQVLPFVGSAISRETFDEIAGGARRFLAKERKTLLSRVAAGHIRDGHGDLRAEHVYLEDGIDIIDCIEFNRRFRYADTAADLAFLAMDLDALGAPDLSRALVAEYGRAAGDDVAPVIGFYLCYRAFTRGKVACLRSSQPGQPQEARNAEVAEARRYFHLALKYGRGDSRPVVVLIAGLTGTGKSTLAAALGGVFAAEVATADEVRKRLAGITAGEHRDDPVDTGIYAPEVNVRVYGTLLAAAESALLRGRSVILDATYRRRSDRDAARFLARRMGARFAAVECVAPDEVVRERIEQRRAEGSSWSDGRWEVYLQQRAAFEPLEEIAVLERATVNASAPLAVQTAQVLHHIEHASQTRG